MKKYWEKIPEKYQEIIKEIARWSIATLYAIVVELVTTGELDGLGFSVIVKIVIFRFLDRVMYLVSKDTTQDKMRTFLRSLLLVK